METHKRESERSFWDQVWVGFVLAIVVPLVIMALYWYALLSGSQPFSTLFSEMRLFMKVFSICASPVLLLFMYFNKKNWTNGSKGMVLAMVILVVFTVITML